MEGSTSDAGGFFSSDKKGEHYSDPYADALLGYYKALNMEESAMKAMLMIAPIGLIAVFYVFVSQSTSSLISFSAWIFSIVFIIIAIGMLCEILKKDCGPGRCKTLLKSSEKVLKASSLLNMALFSNMHF